MENRIKECQLDLFADRTSAATMRANQLRLWFASLAYVLLCALRRIGLADTQFAAAACGTIRFKPLKLGALVRISVRRVKLAARRWATASFVAPAVAPSTVALTCWGACTAAVQDAPTIPCVADTPARSAGAVFAPQRGIAANGFFFEGSGPASSSWRSPRSSGSDTLSFEVLLPNCQPFHMVRPGQ